MAGTIFFCNIVRSWSHVYLLKGFEEMVKRVPYSRINNLRNLEFPINFIYSIFIKFEITQLYSTTPDISAGIVATSTLLWENRCVGPILTASLNLRLVPSRIQPLVSWPPVIDRLNVDSCQRTGFSDRWISVEDSRIFWYKLVEFLDSCWKFSGTSGSFLILLCICGLQI